VQKADTVSGLIRLREELHHSILLSRAVENLILRPQFERLWEDSDEQKKLELKTLIIKSDKAGILLWIKNHPSIDVEDKSIRDLMQIARRHSIKNYSRLTRHQLIVNIREVEARNGSV
jgi:hypothetical protein